MLIINNYEEFASHLGEVLGTSDWLEVPQERINLFADATLDHQWIHVDETKAKRKVLSAKQSCTVTSRSRSFPTFGAKSSRCATLRDGQITAWTR